MINKFLYAAVLSSLSLIFFSESIFAQNKTETFKVNKGGSLKIESTGGDIKVSSWEKNEVKIVYDDDDHKNTIIKQNGNNVEVVSRDFIDFEITVPSEYSLNLNTSGGDIDVVSNIKGNVRINTSGGDIEIKDVAGEVTVSTSGGDIKCGDVKGDAKLSSSGGDIVAGSVDGECKLSTGGGNVQVNNVAKNLKVATGGGNVQSGNVNNDVNIVTGGGNVSVNKINGSMTITTGGGNVFGVGSKGGNITSGSGNISLKNLSDGVVITSGAGNVTSEFISIKNKESKIVTGYGNITVYIPQDAKVSVYAKVKSSEGNVWSVDKKDLSEVIKSDFKISEEDYNQKEGIYEAVYNINGGGTKLYLTASIGVIEIRKLKR